MRMPEFITKKISQRAVEIARDIAPRKTGRGADSLLPTSKKGEIGIEIPAQVEYMVYQDQGTEPREQTELAGKTIPIRNAKGGIIFRRATEANIGSVKLAARDENGNIVVSKVSWKHPGIKPTHFVDRSLRQATAEWAMRTDSQEIIKLLDESDVSMLMKILKGER